MIGNAASWVGQVLGGRYEVTAALGSGGMAVLYRAQDRKLGCDVAIKVPQAVLLQDESFAKRFDHEIRALVQLSHPHIVKISDLGVHDGLPFAVLQFLAGGTLRTRQRTAVPMRPEDLRGWLADVAAALDFIHKQGFVHRDIKPENILFDGAGHVYLGDFGISKILYDQPGQRQRTVLTTLGSAPGTPQYMAPELILGQKCDGRADQYGLAVTVYELLGGRVPFDGATPTAVYEQQKTAPVPLDALLPSVPKGLAQAVQQALMREPGKRHKDCAAFAKAVLLAKGGSRSPDAKATPPVNATVVQWISASCPKCRETQRVAATAQGKQATCSKCATVFTVPMASQAAKTQQQTAVAGTLVPQKRPVPKARPASVPVKRGSGRMLLVGGFLTVFLLGGLVVAWQTIGEGKMRGWFRNEAKEEAKDGKGILAQNDDGKGKEGALPKKEMKDGSDRKNNGAGIQSAWKKKNVPAVDDGKTIPIGENSGTILGVFVSSKSAFPQDGRAITSRADNSLVCWNLDSGKETLRFSKHKGVVQCVVFSRDGKRLLSCARNDESIHLWDLDDGSEIKSFDGNKGEGVHRVAFTPDGSAIVALDFKWILRKWDIASGKISSETDISRDLDLAVWEMQDAKQAGATNLQFIHKGVRHFWEYRQLLLDNSMNAAMPIITISPDGTKALIKIGDQLYYKNGKFALYDIEAKRIVHILQGHQETVHTLVFSPDGNKILSGSSDGTARLWDANTGKELHSYEGHKVTFMLDRTVGVRLVQFLPDGTRILTISENIRIWKLPK